MMNDGEQTSVRTRADVEALGGEIALESDLVDAMPETAETSPVPFASVMRRSADGRFYQVTNVLSDDGALRAKAADILRRFGVSADTFSAG